MGLAATRGTPSETRWEIRCLGEFAILQDGTPMSRWKAGRGRTLFEYLLANHEVVVLKEQLAAILWPTTMEPPGASSLKVMVHGVRRNLESLTGGARDLEITYRDFGYALSVSDRVRIDFLEFEQLAKRARTAELAGDVTAAKRLYEDAMTHYRGDFLVGESDEWLLEQRQWLRDLALRCLLRLAHHAVDEDPDRAVEYCRRVCDIDPANENAYRILMYINAQRGQLSQVKKWHEVCERRLKRDLDVPPDDSTEQLLESALRGESVVLPVAEG